MYCKVHSTLAKAGYACMYVVVLLLRSNSNKQARPSWNLHQFFNGEHRPCRWLRWSTSWPPGAVLAPLLFSVLSLAGPEPPGNTYIRSVAIHFTVTIKCTALVHITCTAYHYSCTAVGVAVRYSCIHQAHFLPDTEITLSRGH